MKVKQTSILIRFMTWGVIFSIITFILIRSTRISFEENFSTSNYGPSGTSAQIEILQQLGFNTQNKVINRRKSNEVYVLLSRSENLTQAEEFIKTSPSGSTIYLLQIPSISSDSKTTEEVRFADTQKSLGVVSPLSATSSDNLKPQLGTIEPYALLENGQNNNPFLLLSKYETKTLVNIVDARFALNANIDQVNNATVLASMINSISGKSQPINWVNFTESDATQYGLLEELGPFFVSAALQLKVLLLLVFVTLAIRFGLAPEFRPLQRGGKELVDALAFLSRRKQQHQWAVRALLDRILSELERRLRVARTQIALNPEKFLDAEEASLIREVVDAIKEPINREYAMHLAKRLSRLV